MKAIFATSIYILASFVCTGQTTIKIPEFNDKYSNYVKSLESGQVDIDYQDFRFSLIESDQFIMLSKQSSELSKLKEQMYKQMNKSNYEKVIDRAKEILSIDYTNMRAHKALRQTYKIIGDTLNENKYQAIQFGLLNSIVKKGDGKSCATAWPVIQIEEEYFILQMIEAKLIQQSIDNNGGVCDRMKVEVDGSERVYFFETSKVFEGYKKLGLK
jgi:Domain of unknown function (DUF4919)